MTEVINDSQNKKSWFASTLGVPLVRGSKAVLLFSEYIAHLGNCVSGDASTQRSYENHEID